MQNYEQNYGNKRNHKKGKKEEGGIEAKKLQLKSQKPKLISDLITLEKELSIDL